MVKVRRVTYIISGIEFSNWVLKKCKRRPVMTIWPLKLRMALRLKNKLAKPGVPLMRLLDLALRILG